MSLFRRHPAVFQSHGGFASRETVELRGRVLRMRELSGDARPAGRWRTLLRSLRLFLSREVAGAVVEMECGGRRHRATSDDEGYVLFRVPRPEAVEGPWLELPARVVEAGKHEPSATTVAALVRVPGKDVDLAVVSDIDDTILRTEVGRRWRMIWRSLSHDAYRREAIAGAPRMYRDLARHGRPFFYVSNGPWNLYPVLVRFLDHSEFPDGPLFLRDFGWKGRHARKRHKVDSLRHLLGVYQRLRFVLIGDSGEKDARIYATVAREFPGRIAAVFIRMVGSQESAMIREARQVFADQGVPFATVGDFAEMRNRIDEEGWIQLGSGAGQGPGRAG